MKASRDHKRHLTIVNAFYLMNALRWIQAEMTLPYRQTFRCCGGLLKSNSADKVAAGVRSGAAKLRACVGYPGLSGMFWSGSCIGLVAGVCCTAPELGQRPRDGEAA